MQLNSSKHRKNQQRNRIWMNQVTRTNNFAACHQIRGGKLKLTRTSDVSSEDEECNFEGSYKTDSKPVHEHLDAEMNLCTPSLWKELTIVPNCGNEFQINFNGETKTEDLANPMKEQISKPGVSGRIQNPRLLINL